MNHRTNPSERKVTGSEREKFQLMVATTFRQQRPSEGHTYHSDQHKKNLHSEKTFKEIH